MVGAQHKAKLMAIEHRFYGKSQPFSNWATENF
jgi:pimeloyl-ACP methyl ester carboxylesterase